MCKVKNQVQNKQPQFIFEDDFLEDDILYETLKVVFVEKKSKRDRLKKFPKIIHGRLKDKEI